MDSPAYPHWDTYLRSIGSTSQRREFTAAIRGWVSKGIANTVFAAPASDGRARMSAVLMHFARELRQLLRCYDHRATVLSPPALWSCGPSCGLQTQKKLDHQQQAGWDGFSWDDVLQARRGEVELRCRHTLELVDPRELLAIDGKPVAATCASREQLWTWACVPP